MSRLLFAAAIHAMNPNQPHVRETVAVNLRRLIEFRHWSERQLAAKTGISQKTINNILNQVTAPTIETLDRIGQAFGLSGWELMLPDLAPDKVATHSLTELLQFYNRASDEGREYILRIAEKESKYSI